MRLSPGNEVITGQQIKANVWDENPHICIPSCEPHNGQRRMLGSECIPDHKHQKRLGEVSANVVSYFDTHTLLKCPSSPL